jgi:hypothetical protein
VILGAMSIRELTVDEFEINIPRIIDSHIVSPLVQLFNDD